VFARAQLLERVWPAGGGGASAGDPRTVDVHVRWLRERLERDPSAPAALETVRGGGYRLRGPAGGWLPGVGVVADGAAPDRGSPISRRHCYE